MRRKTKRKLAALTESDKMLHERLVALETEFEGRVDHFEEEDEWILNHLATLTLASNVSKEAMETLEKRVDKLQAALDEAETAPSRAERDMQDGMDAIFGYTPPSMKGGESDG